MYPLDHIGIATQNIDEAITEYGRVFGYTVGFREVVASQNTEIAFLTLSNTKIELLAPHNGQGPIRKFLDNKGPGLHHLCYRVDDIEAELARLDSIGYQLIDAKPRPGAHNTLIAFVHPKSFGGVLTELCEYL